MIPTVSSKDSISLEGRPSKRSKRVGNTTNKFLKKKPANVTKTSKQLFNTNEKEPIAKASSQTLFPSNTNHIFPVERSALIKDGIDYSQISNFRNILNKFHARGYLTFPPFILELGTVFLRCINTINHNPLDAWNNKRGMYTVSRKFLLQLTAALGWIYAFGYSYRLPNNKTPLQTLGQLNQPKFSKIFQLSMELVQLLLASTRETYNIDLSEVLEAKIGAWFNNRIAQIKKGIWNDAVLLKDGTAQRKARNGIYLPFYLAVHAIHPLCPKVQEEIKENVNLTEDENRALLREPKLYLKEANNNEIRLFPRSPDGKINYNLWFFYNHLQLDPDCQRN